MSYTEVVLANHAFRSDATDNLMTDLEIERPPRLSRRRALGLLAGGAVGVAFAGDALAATAIDSERRLAFVHTHTGETLDLIYAAANGYDAKSLIKVNELLRDFRTSDVHVIDPKLLDLLHALARSARSSEPFHVISGYRSPRTNSALRAHSSGVAKYSLHMEGKAIDIRLPGVTLSRVRDKALGLARGGVGYYPGSDFVHVDTGRVRAW
jgi:uncharacterized protein YcbK (DUF882 family)